ncbi:MAG: phosphatidylcholine/phosphatidylserine synthase [Pyrinomonadaceae bacterium]|nr:phosphatidylcholine/phosphatidylserine synthase [Pyrinomonadaceae bacterium]
MYSDKILPWSVHVFTASGLLAGFLAILAINRSDWRAAMAWLLVALVVDGIDGTLARIFKVSEKLPNIKGKMIDTVVDFTNYAVVPAYFIYMAGVVSPAVDLPIAFLILLVSAIYYGKEGMVSHDYYFIGFPVMWNVVVFYLVFVFPDPSIPVGTLKIVNALVIVILAVLHFVPVKFAYPSRATRMKLLTIAATFSILLVMPLVVWLYPSVPVWLRILAIVNLAYFGVLAFFDTSRSWKSEAA